MSKTGDILKKALQEIESWGEQNGGHWCREHAKQALASIEEWPDKTHESHKIVHSSGVSTSDFIWDDCDATDDVTGSCGTLRKPCKGAK